MTKYLVKYTSTFKKNLKKALKQGKNIDKLLSVVEKLANKEELDEKYRNHNLINDKYYKNCGECHIEPDWLLIYQYNDNNLILLLVSTGSHSDLF
ncbi:MAG TPA: type II toxin-antitoxin system YafQ family toxin [Candidatus Onthocola stercorigallinarum]|nr:type II toxin-antitoxin system YafQ family toxin [Candidatus Onthocola stercorigallinarum]